MTHPSSPSGLSVYLSPRALTVLALGFTCGLPWSLTHTTLGYWLSQEGASMKAVGLFSLAALPYSLKFVWAPLIDAFRWAPFGSKALSRRQGWMIWAQLGLMVSLATISLINPQTELIPLAYLTIVATFFAASQDIAVDAWRVETLPVDEQGVAASWATLGYRVGMYASSAGAMLLSVFMPWRSVYLCMATCVGLGVVATWVSERVTRRSAPEMAGPHQGAPLPRLWMSLASLLTLSPLFVLFASRSELWQGAQRGLEQWLLSLGFLTPTTLFASLPCLALGLALLSQRRRARWWSSGQAWLTQARGAWGDRWPYILLFVALYRLGDHLLSLFLYPSLNDLGFSAIEIATVAKTWGLIATFIGTFLGGWLVYRLGISRVMVIAGVAQMSSNLALSAQALIGHDVGFLYVSIGAQDLALGMVNATFVAYISALCDVRHAATHFALLSALSSLLKTFIQAGSGWVAESLKVNLGAQRGWALYFALTSLMALPGLALLLWLNRSQNTTKVAPEPLEPPM